MRASVCYKNTRRPMVLPRWMLAIIFLLSRILYAAILIIIDILKGILDLLKDLVWFLIEPVLLEIEPRVDRLYVSYKVKMDNARRMRAIRRK